VNPNFFEGKVVVGHTIVILKALDEFYYQILFESIWVDISAQMAQNQKITIFKPMKEHIFSLQCGLILVYYGSSS
jgi:hypothetical protein